MAWNEVKDEDVPQNEWKQLKVVGDKIEGLILTYEERDDSYDGRAYKKNTYGFDGLLGPFRIDAPKQLHDKLQVAKGRGLGKGGRVRATVTGTKDIGNDQPLKLIKLEWSMHAVDISAFKEAQRKHRTKGRPAPAEPVDYEAPGPEVREVRGQKAQTRGEVAPRHTDPSDDVPF